METEVLGHTKRKIVFLVPHLSTGGMPQYTVNLMKGLIEDNDVFCVEYDFIAYDLIIQRERVKELLGGRFYSLSDDKGELIRILEKVKPDIVHLQEVPEYFLSNEVADKLYADSREYLIVETSHDSSFDVKGKRYFPDRFALISEYQRSVFSGLGIPIDLVESDIVYSERGDREKGLRELGLDPGFKHVLSVGLFTPRKNQAEAMEYARRLQGSKVQFHFVGNQADNFKFYWEPILNNLPGNVKIWGERSDLDKFYSCMDMLLFTSKGGQGDMETSPLVIREAIGFGLPILMYKLPVYLGMYDEFEGIEYLGESKSKNLESILSVLGVETESGLEVSVEYDKTANKVTLVSNRTLRNVVFSIRDIDSTAVIWSGDYVEFAAGVYYWMIPAAKGNIDFELDPNFGGMVVELYEEGELVFSHDIRIKIPQKAKPKLKVDNYTEPVFINYNEFFVDGIYDKYLKGKRFDTVVDVGANVGVWIEYLKSCSKVGRIFAVEPNRNALKILKRSVGDEVTIVECAMLSEDKDIMFYTSQSNSLVSSKESSIVEGYGDMVGYQVKGVTFRSFVESNKIESIDLMKIDIETGEYDLIESMTEEDFGKVKRFLIEFHLLNGRTRLGDVENLLRKLNSMGYAYDICGLVGSGGFIFAEKV